MKSHKCEFCDVDVRRACYAKHLRSEKHLENGKLNEKVIPEWLFQEPNKRKFKKICNPTPLKQIARDNNKLYDKQLK